MSRDVSRESRPGRVASESRGLSVRSPDLAAQLLTLQRQAGNRATAAALRRHAVPTPFLRRRKWWQFWKPKTAAPIAATPVAAPGPAPSPPAAKTRFANTSVWIAAAPTYPGGNYVADVTAHLQDIQSRVGSGFWTGLGTNGKVQNIIYGGPNSNQCAGGAGGYKRLRKWHDTGDTALFAQELNQALTAAGRDAAWLVGQLRATGLPHWTNTTDPAPIASFSDPAQTLAKVNSWIAGTARPTIDEMDVLMLVLEPYAANGNGVGSRINYDPLKTSTASGPRPPQLALFHELVHAFYNAQGAQLGREDSVQEDNGGRLYELMAVGLPPFDHAPFSENAFRALWPHALRLNYP